MLHQDRKNFVTNMLYEKIYGKILSNPSSNEYINYIKCINENYTLKSELNNLINKNNELLSIQSENKKEKQKLEEIIKMIKSENNILLSFKKTVLSNKVIKMLLKMKNISY